MRERVGDCKQCGKEVYCNEGFLNGVVLEDRTLVCFDCAEPSEAESGEAGTGRKDSRS